MRAAETLDDGCTNPSINEALTSYCFGDLNASDRERVSMHLRQCEVCWEEFQRLDGCVRVLRHDPNLALGAPTGEMLSVLGMSGRLDLAFGGHRGFVLLIASLYASLYVASVWTELGYSYDRFGMLAWILSPVVLLGAGGAIVGALAVGVSRARTSRSGLGWAVTTALAVLALMTVVVAWLLPSTATIQASFQTRSASGGYVKNVLLYFAPLLLFILPTFHTVVSLQRELRAGRHRFVGELLTNSPYGIAPRGAWFVPPWLLIAVLVAAVFIGYQGTNHMLDNLSPGPYANLFTTALHVRVVLWYVVALLCLAWYQRSLQELKREAVAAGRLLGDIH